MSFFSHESERTSGIIGWGAQELDAGRQEDLRESTGQAQARYPGAALQPISVRTGSPFGPPPAPQTMSRSNFRCLAVFISLLISFVQAASASDILIGDAKSQPESLTLAPGGVLIVGSASSPFVYKVRSGSTTAEKFIDLSSPGTFFLGMLADASTNTLWTVN